MKWTEINISTSKENEELVLGVFHGMGISSLEIEDPNDLIDLSNQKEGWDFWGIDLDGIDLKSIKIKAYCSEVEDIDSILLFLKENIEIKGLGKLDIKEIEDEDFLNNWKKYFKPFKIGENIIIKPTWEDYDKKDGDIIIEIDPGMAFGTGTHETTSLCIEGLEKYVKEGDTVFDIGCGSGILSIVSAKLGAKDITAIDLDPLCVKVSKENVAKNGLENIIEVKKGNLLDFLDGKADIIVANIIAEAILTITGDVKSYLKDGGIFISSGIILEKKDKVLEALAGNGFKIEEVNTQGEWVSIVALNK